MKIYIKSFGCSTNFADGEVMGGCLKNAGYQVVSNPREAKVLIYNTCAVKTPTENKMISILKGVPENKKLIVAGCLPLINLGRLKREVRFDGAIGPAPGLEVIELVERVLNGERIVILRNDFTPPLSLSRCSASNVIRIIPIAYGCRGECSYCCVRFARGQLRSYSVEEILNHVNGALAEGFSEIWLTAQDSSCYGMDIGTNLPTLLKSVGGLNREFFVRVGMMNPNHVVGILDELMDVYRDKKIFKFLHLPVQSGDDGVLNRMNRQYSVEDFKKIVQSFRRELPRITIATDFICGFPGEDEQAFQRSLALIREAKPDVVNVSRFFPRPGTPAMRMSHFHGWEIKRRSREMSKLVREISLERNRSWLGWKGEVLIDERGKGGSWVGRNFAYKPVVLKSKENLLGKRIIVRIKNVFPTYLEAEMV